MSVHLHQTKRVMVMTHSDCGTYGGLEHFKGDRQAEAEHHRSELLRAGELLTSEFPGISVEPYFVKFDGIWEVKDAEHLQSTPQRKLSDTARKIA